MADFKKYNGIILVALVVVLLYFAANQQSFFSYTQTLKFEDSGRYANFWIGDVSVATDYEETEYRFQAEKTDQATPRRYLFLTIAPSPATCTYPYSTHVSSSLLSSFYQSFGGILYDLDAGQYGKKVNFTLEKIDPNNFATLWSNRKSLDAADIDTGTTLTFNDKDGAGTLGIVSGGRIGGIYDCPDAEGIMAWKKDDKTIKIVRQYDFDQHLNNYVFLSCGNPLAATFYTQECKNARAYFANPPDLPSFKSVAATTSTNTKLIGYLKGDVTGKFTVYADANIFDSVVPISRTLSKPNLVSCSPLTIEEHETGTVDVILKNTGVGSTAIVVDASADKVTISPERQTVNLQPSQSATLTYEVRSVDISNKLASQKSSLYFTATTQSQGQVASSEPLTCEITVEQAPTGAGSELTRQSTTNQPEKEEDKEEQTTCQFPQVKQSSTSTSGVPILSSLPFIGDSFKTTTTSEQCVFDPNITFIVIAGLGVIVLVSVLPVILKKGKG